MSSYIEKLKYKKINCNSESDSDDQRKDEDEEDKKNEDTESKPKKSEKPTLRGKLAALISNLDNSDSEEESDSQDDVNYLKNKSRGGIYAKKLNQTKKEKKVINHKFYEVDKHLINETDDSKSVSKADTDSENNSDQSDKSLDDIDSDSSINAKKKRLEKEKTPELEIQAPPPPQNYPVPKRKSTSLIDKQFKELETFRNKTETKRLLNDSDRIVINSDDDNDDDYDDDELNTVTVKVSTKNGLKKWDINENQSFTIIFQKLAEIENTGVENIVLMLKDKIISFNDTPASINLKAYHILDCGKTVSINQERVKVIEDGEECEHGPNMVTVNLQTEAGRKSRVKFLISMDEPFESVLRKYCEKKGIEFEKHSLQMEGDKIDLKETPRDLDFEDDFMIDVTRSSKPVLQQIHENRKNYEFDDDILLA